MADPDPAPAAPGFAEITGVIVSPRGLPRISRPGRQADPARPRTELPAFGRVGYLAVSATELAIFHTTKVGMHPGPRGEPLTRVPLSELVDVTLDERLVVAFLELSFADGAHWTLQVGRINRGRAHEVVARLRPA
jgi:hypothetical protein